MKVLLQEIERLEDLEKAIIDKLFKEFWFQRKAMICGGSLNMVEYMVEYVWW